MKLEALFEKVYNERELQLLHPDLYKQLDLSEVTMDHNHHIPGTFKISVVWRYDDAATEPETPPEKRLA